MLHVSTLCLVAAVCVASTVQKHLPGAWPQQHSDSCDRLQRWSDRDSRQPHLKQKGNFQSKIRYFEASTIFPNAFYFPLRIIFLTYPLPLRRGIWRYPNSTKMHIFLINSPISAKPNAIGEHLRSPISLLRMQHLTNENEELSSKSRLKSQIPTLARGNTLETVEAEWEVLYDGNMLKKILKNGEGEDFASLKSNVSIEFSIHKISGDLLTNNQNLNISMLEFPLSEASPGIQKALTSMKRLEKSVFLLSPSMHTLQGLQIEREIIGKLDWLQLEITMCNFLDSNDKLIGLGPDSDLSWIPEEVESDMKPEEEVQLKADVLTRQLEQQMSTNPSSPLWEDVAANLTAPHRKKLDKFFEKSLNLNKPQDPSLDGSRGYVESFLAQGTKHGYDLGERLEGRGKFYVWRETPFLLELLLPVHEGVRAKHVHCEFAVNELKVYIGGRMVLSDKLKGSIEVQSGSFWTMNDAAAKFPPLSKDELVPFFCSLLNTQSGDTIQNIQSKPCINISLRKQQNFLWGNVFQSA